ncbi:MAG: hypothetical protein K8Q97_04795 [Candidatus Andersenbacteria bacterium]|nr:hypothetical protein [Candidatus Andersenbacteria bacterium]
MLDQNSAIGWVRIAGSAEAIARATPPYWRLTPNVSGEVKQQLVHEVRVTGTADGVNMVDGMEQGASFLLWFQMYGSWSVVSDDGKHVLVIDLQKVPDVASSIVMDPVQEIVGKISVYGAPDLARAGNLDRWRCVVNGREFLVQSMRVYGEVTHDNFQTVENVSPENRAKYRQQWLSFNGVLRTDIEGNASIEVR